MTSSVNASMTTSSGKNSTGSSLTWRDGENAKVGIRLNSPALRRTLELQACHNIVVLELAGEPLFLDYFVLVTIDDDWPGIERNPADHMHRTVLVDIGQPTK